MFHVSVIAPNTTMVIYGIVFGGMHPTFYICSITVPVHSVPVLLQYCEYRHSVPVLLVM